MNKTAALSMLFILMSLLSAYGQEDVEHLSGLQTEFLCELKANLSGPPQIIGYGPYGLRMIFHVSGGTVTGPKLNGELLPGADWVVVRPDGVAELDVRGTMWTHDGKLIYSHYRGISIIPPELSQKIAMGGSVDPSEYYYRTTPIFETGAEEYSWLSKVITVGVGTMGKDYVSYKIYIIR
jgi:hypothetical protein